MDKKEYLLSKIKENNQKIELIKLIAVKNGELLAIHLKEQNIKLKLKLKKLNK